MRFPAVLWRGDGSDFAVTFPDLPGCIAAGSTADEAIRVAEDALSFHLEGLSADGLPLPNPGGLDTVLGAERGQDTIVLLVTARPPKAPAVRVNITLDKNLLAEIDAAAASAGTTRSGFLAEAARRVMHR